DRDGPAEDASTHLRVPTRVARLAIRLERTPLEQCRGHEEGPGERVDTADVRVEEVEAAHALSPQLRVEVEAAAGQPTALQDLVHRQRQLIDGVRKLIRVPAVLV